MSKWAQFTDIKIFTKQAASHKKKKKKHNQGTSRERDKCQTKHANGISCVQIKKRVRFIN